MEIRYNVTGSERKRLVQTIAQTFQVKAKNLRMPSIPYEIHTYTVYRVGQLSFIHRNNIEDAERHIQPLAVQRLE